MVTQKFNPTAVSFSLLAGISCSVFSHPCLPEGCYLPNKTCALLISCAGKLQRNPRAAENKVGNNFWGLWVWFWLVFVFFFFFIPQSLLS